MQKPSSNSRMRCVGLTIETRPDFLYNRTYKTYALSWNNRVELGVQILDDKTYIWMKRGHTIIDVARATELLRNAGLKIVYHIMPGLAKKKKILFHLSYCLIMKDFFRIC